jgi:hypothetical protein
LSEKYPDLKVSVISADVTKLDQMEVAIQNVKIEFHSARIAGVMQIAMVEEDTVFSKMTAEGFNKV